MKRFHFKTLRSRYAALLITPVVVVLLAAGTIGFIYARNTMLDEWKRSVALQLERAAHEIDMRLSKPVELMSLFAGSGEKAADAGLLEAIVGRLESLPGVVRVDLHWHAPADGARSHRGRSMAMGMGRFMRFNRGDFINISPPRVDESISEQTVKISMILLDGSDSAVGNIEIVLRFSTLVAGIEATVWWKNAVACIADRDTGAIVLTSGLMKGRRQLGDTADPLERSVRTAIAETVSGTVWSEGHPPERIAGFHGIRTFPWALVVFAEGKTVLAPIIRFRNGFVLGAAILIATIYGIIHLNVSRMSDTVRHLSRRAVTVAAGDYGETIEVATRDEIGQLAESFNTMIEGLREKETIHTTFGRYVDPDFARTLLKQPDAGRLGGRRQEVTILMADIRGFTPMTEQLSPEETIEVLNRYFSAIIPLVRTFRGIIVDFVGDGILAFFEPVDESLEAATRRCVECAFHMQAALQRLNDELAARGLPAIKMGMGVNSGPVVVGNIGSEARKKYGIVGSTVNVTQRIQGQAGEGEVVVSSAVYRMIAPQVATLRSFSTPLKGVTSALQLVAVAPAAETKTETILNR